MRILFLILLSSNIFAIGNIPPHKAQDFSTNQTFWLDPQFITSELTPNVIATLWIKNQELSSIVLKRKFSDEISEFIDRETVERKNDEN